MRLRAQARTRTDWTAALDRMIAEIRQPDPRNDAYWAHQLAFGPALVHALALRLRDGAIAPSDRESVGRIVLTSIRLLRALPEPVGGDPTTLRVLALRQAWALAVGRRSHLVKVARRLGLSVESEVTGTVPLALLRCYPILH